MQNCQKKLDQMDPMFVHLFAKNVNGYIDWLIDWSHKFGVRINQRILYKYLQNIFKSKIIKEIFEADFEGTSSTGPNILFTSCQEPAGIGTDSIVNLITPQNGVISYPNINKK